MTASEPTERPSFAVVLERLETFVNRKGDNWLDSRVWQTGTEYVRFAPPPDLAEPAEPAELVSRKSLKTIVTSIF